MEIIAWRGASWKHLENTVLAAIQAEEDGYDRIELDTRLTSDGKMIAFHSPTFGSWDYHIDVDLVPWKKVKYFRKRYKKQTYCICQVSQILEVTKIPILLHVKREVDVEAYKYALEGLPRFVDIHSNSEAHLSILHGHHNIQYIFKSCYTPQDEVLDWVDGYMLGHKAFGDATALVPEWLERIPKHIKWVFAGNSQSWIDEVKEYSIDGLLTGRIDRYGN